MWFLSFWKPSWTTCTSLCAEKKSEKTLVSFAYEILKQGWNFRSEVLDNASRLFYVLTYEMENWELCGKMVVTHLMEIITAIKQF